MLKTRNVLEPINAVKNPPISVTDVKIKGCSKPPCIVMRVHALCLQRLYNHIIQDYGIILLYKE